jgi:hypothetical protein
MPETFLDAGDCAEHWLAFQYLTGELNPQEASDFEARLSTDLRLQIALADSVLLTTGLVETQKPCPSPRMLRRRSAGIRFWSGAVTLAALCLLGVGQLLQLLQPASIAERSMAQGFDDRSAADAAKMLALWSQLDDQMDVKSTVTAADVSPIDDPVDDDFGGDDEASDLEVPDWMLAAVLKEELHREDADLVGEEQL